MIYFAKFIASLIMPPGCFIIILLFFIIHHYKHEKRVSKLIILFISLIYVTSIPCTANLLIHSLEYTYLPPSNPNGDIIVMLTGGATLDSPDISGDGSTSGATANRLLTAARLYKKISVPIIISGGKVFKDSGNESEISKRQLIDLGIPENYIIIENNSRNSAENAHFTSQILKGKYRKPILVTSAFHMKRSIMNFSKEGVKTIIPYPADYLTNTQINIGLDSFIPTYGSFNTFGIALHEYLGIFQIQIKNIFK